MERLRDPRARSVSEFVVLVEYVDIPVTAVLNETISLFLEGITLKGSSSS